MRSVYHSEFSRHHTGPPIPLQYPMLQWDWSCNNATAGHLSTRKSALHSNLVTSSATTPFQTVFLQPGTVTPPALRWFRISLLPGVIWHGWLHLMGEATGTRPVIPAGFLCAGAERRQPSSFAGFQDAGKRSYTPVRPAH